MQYNVESMGAFAAVPAGGWGNGATSLSTLGLASDLHCHCRLSQFGSTGGLWRCLLMGHCWGWIESVGCAAGTGERQGSCRSSQGARS